MKIDNGFKVIRYDGTVVFAEETGEIYQVTWQPFPAKTFKAPKVQANEAVAKKVEPPKPAKYVPPHARNSPAAAATTSRSDSTAIASGPKRYNNNTPAQQSNLPPGWSDDSPKKKKKATPTTPTASPQPLTKTSTSTASPQSSDADPQKKLRTLKKKLTDIDTLKKKQQQIEPLDAAQLQKICTEQDIRKQIAALSEQLSTIQV
jgi:translation initiation factor 2A